MDLKVIEDAEKRVQEAQAHYAKVMNLKRFERARQASKAVLVPTNGSYNEGITMEGDVLKQVLDFLEKLLKKEL